MSRPALATSCLTLVAVAVVGVPGLLAAAQQTAIIAKTETASGEKSRQDWPPFVSWQGRESAISEPWFARCEDESAWLALWERHSGKPAQRDNVGRAFIPRVNFEKCSVVAMFLGKKVNSNGVVIDSIGCDENQCLIRFDESTFQTMSVAPDQSGGAVDVRPYGIFVIPKTKLPIVVEENVQGVKDQPAKWKPRAKLE